MAVSYTVDGKFLTEIRDAKPGDRVTLSGGNMCCSQFTTYILGPVIRLARNATPMFDLGTPTVRICTGCNAEQCNTCRRPIRQTATRYKREHVSFSSCQCYPSALGEYILQQEAALAVEHTNRMPDCRECAAGLTFDPYGAYTNRHTRAGTSHLKLAAELIAKDAK